jgi:hypothetical protein
MTTPGASSERGLRPRVIQHIDEIDRGTWNALGAEPYPFLRHEFLAALESQDCLGERFGWLPRHVTLWDDNKLVGAVPLYLKFNSYGEFVFDWAWADAYERNGQRYYPKLVSASPYTPATGPKLLVHPAAPGDTRRLLIETCVELARQSGSSSLHWLFTEADEIEELKQSGQLHRVGCQFHWQNAGYADFDAFLATLTSAKRKNIRKERRRVREAGIEFRLLDGHSASASDWETFQQLYESTFHRKSGMPTLSLGFFTTLAATLPDGVLLILADHQGETVAAAFCLVGADTLYGRHWGCNSYFRDLHFEACYYQGLDFCIRHGLTRFEPGAQGEHKVARGFLPVATHSAHWLADQRFREAIARHLDHERAGMDEYIAEMARHSPYRTIEDT